MAEPPGLIRKPSSNDERCLNCKFLEWRESMPVCGKFDYPVMHWYFCKVWESHGKLADLGPLKPPPIRPFTDKNLGE